MFLISTQLFQEMRKQVHKVPVLHLEITPSCKTSENATEMEQMI